MSIADPSDTRTCRYHQMAPCLTAEERDLVEHCAAEIRLRMSHGWDEQAVIGAAASLASKIKQHRAYDSTAALDVELGLVGMPERLLSRLEKHFRCRTIGDLLQLKAYQVRGVKGLGEGAVVTVLQTIVRVLLCKQLELEDVLKQARVRAPDSLSGLVEW